MLAGKTLLDCTNLVFPNDYKKYEKVIYKYLRINISSLDFRFKKIDKTRNYLLDAIKYNFSKSKKYSKTSKYLNYVERFLILVSTFNGCISISAFASLGCVPAGITSSAVGITNCEITVEIKRYKSIIIKKKKKHEKIVLLGKGKLNTIKVLISESLIDSYIVNDSYVIHDEFILVNNVFTEDNEIREEIKILEISVEHII